MRAILVSVDYSDILQHTLAWNRHHFEEVDIVTSSDDEKNVRPIAEANDAKVIVTDLFYADKAIFNKFRALEHGLDVMGRHGWLCIMDADVLWPKVIHIRTCLGDGPLYLDIEGTDTKSPPEEKRFKVKQGQLCTPYRRMMEDIPNPIVFPPENLWSQYPRHRNISEHAGYSQLFHAQDPVLGDPPWHQTDWVHAGGADSFFQQKWPHYKKVRPPWEVLHIGKAGCNWMGRATPYLDGTIPEDHIQKSKSIVELWKIRSSRRQRGEDPFSAEKIS